MRLCFLIPVLVALLHSNAHAQYISAKQVPAVVDSAFRVKFPAVCKVKWQPGKKWYEADFKSNGMEQSAYFSKSGKWLETETQINLADVTPPVSKVLAEHFTQYTIVRVELVDNRDKGLMYQITISDALQTGKIRFSPEGRVLDEEKEDEEED